jgi:hypothetical protein
MYDDDSPYLPPKPKLREVEDQPDTDQDQDNLEDENDFLSIHDEFEQLTLQGIAFHNSF